MRKTSSLTIAAIILITALKTEPVFAQIYLLPYCSNTRYTHEISGNTGTNTTTVAVQAFTQNCIGSLTASLRGFGSSLSFTQLQLEQKISGSWVVVENGWDISYKADPGTYRFTILRTGTNLDPINWRLKYSRPQ